MRTIRHTKRNSTSNRICRQPCLPTWRQQHTKGYQSLGSFHSEDLGALMSLSDNDYSVPSLPFDEEELPSESDFMLDFEKWTFLNHGAFGAALALGYHRAEKWRFYLEQQPLRHFDRALLPHLAYSTRRLASFCSTTTKGARGCALIQNATAGLNGVLRGFKREYGCDAHILVWDTSYGR